MYDLVGDVHGHAAALLALLRRLGYRERHGVWRHDERTLVLVGDLIDRGPEVAETLRLVRPMVEAGAARVVLGNHEWNALAYHQPDPDTRRGHLRSHNPTHRRQHHATLQQLGREELREQLSWFRTLPPALDLPGLRVVHACWDETALGVLTAAAARHGGITDAFLVEAENSESLLFAALEIVLKGREMTLPLGAAFVDRDGVRRVRARVRWYRPAVGETVASYAFPAEPELPASPLPVKVVAEAQPYPPPPAGAPPVFFGHYWLRGEHPALLADNVCCLDWSVARGGFLCAYRFDGEPVLDPARFVSAHPDGRLVDGPGESR